MRWLLLFFIGLQCILFVIYIAYPEYFVLLVVSALSLTIFLTLMFYKPLYSLLFIVIVMVVTNHYFPFAAILVFRERMVPIAILLMFLVLSGIFGKSMLSRGDFGRPIVLLLSILFVSALYGLARGNSRFVVAQEFEMYVYLLVYFLVVSLVTTEKEAYLVVKTMLIATVAMACIAIITFFYILQFENIFFYKGPFGHIVYSMSSMIPRVISNAEMYLPIAVNVIISFLLFARNSKLTKYLLASVLVVLLFAVFISLTRGMWLSTLISSLILIGYYVYQRGRRAFSTLVKATLGAALLFGALIYLFAGQPLLHRIIGFGAVRAASMLQATADISLFNRYQEIIQVWKSLRSQPIFGIGLGGVISWRDMLFPWITHMVFYIHNSYFWMLLKMGVIGFGASLVILYIVFRKAITLLKKLESSHQRVTVVGLITGLVSVLIFSITSPFINLGAGNFYLALTMGLISVVDRLNS
jgi:O-antigen ligase